MSAEHVANHCSVQNMSAIDNIPAVHLIEKGLNDPCTAYDRSL